LLQRSSLSQLNVLVDGNGFVLGVSLGLITDVLRSG